MLSKIVHLHFGHILYVKWKYCDIFTPGNLSRQTQMEKYIKTVIISRVSVIFFYKNVNKSFSRVHVFHKNKAIRFLCNL